jgi:hypothetical protein
MEADLVVAAVAASHGRPTKLGKLVNVDVKEEDRLHWKCQTKPNPSRCTFHLLLTPQTLRLEGRRVWGDVAWCRERMGNLDESTDQKPKQ